MERPVERHRVPGLVQQEMLGVKFEIRKPGNAADRTAEGLSIIDMTLTA